MTSNEWFLRDVIYEWPQSSTMETKAKISDEERIKLAEKLDKELDDFIGSLKKTQYKDGWNEDNWQEVW